MSGRTGKSRNARYEAKRIADGYRKISVWVPAGREAEFKILAERLCADFDLAVGPVRHEPTGKLQKLEGYRR